MNLKLLCIVLIVSAIKTYGQTSPDQNVTWTHYENLNYSISYPETWRLDTSHMMASDFFIFSRKEDSSDVFMENVNLMSYDLQGQSITLDSFVHTSEKQISTMANDYKILQSARLQGQGGNFHKLDFTARQGIYQLRFIQYYFLSKGKCYTLTFTMEQGKYAKYAGTVLKLMDSFRFTE
jgi:hypothetical protein